MYFTYKDYISIGMTMAGIEAVFHSLLSDLPPYMNEAANHANGIYLRNYKAAIDRNRAR